MQRLQRLEHEWHALLVTVALSFLVAALLESDLVALQSGNRRAAHTFQ